MSGARGGGEGIGEAVFVTVGTDHHPFDRLIDWVDSWLANGSGGTGAFVQYGTSQRPHVAAGEAYLPHDEMARKIASARAIVCHGGPGTIIDCMRSGTKPIVVPRRHAMGEHVDDHQVRFTRRLEEAGYIKVAADERQLGALLREALEGSPDFVASKTDDSVKATVERFAEIADPLLPNNQDRVRVLYIGGWGRSGSTLLDRLLGQMEGSFSVGEMRDLWLRGVLENRRCGCGSPFLECSFWTEVGAEAFGGWSRSQAADLHRLRTRYDRPWMLPVLALAAPSPLGLDRYADATATLYRAIARVSGASVIVDSTKIPSYAFLLRRVPAIDLRFVHLVRDSRGVVHSWKKSVERRDAIGHPDRMLKYGVASASGRYLMYNATADLVRHSDLPYLFVRYEDLVAKPGPTLQEVAGFADLPGDVGFLDDDTANIGVSHTVDGNPMRFTQGKLRIKADEEWRASMTHRDQRVVVALTRPLLKRYGYS